MPRGDGTGPMGMGPATGRGAGFCTGYAAPGYAGFGRRCGASGYGRGFNRWNYNAYEPVIDEKKILSDQVDFLENELQLTKQRLSKFDVNK
ncbi:MAG: DUF5320 domain-containing protein [Saccharofermentanales bacterium]